MENSTWQEQFNAEITHAETARAAGNEGMARVCARRAVGIIAGEYLPRQGISTPKPSAYDRIKFMLDLDLLPVEVKPTLEHFLLRIDTNHQLPVNADLIAEARWLADRLLAPSSIADPPDERDH